MKERLVGAALLVLAGVLLIPLFLDGPDESAPLDERQRIALPPAGDADTSRTRTVRMEQHRDTPAPPPPRDDAAAAEAPLPPSEPAAPLQLPPATSAGPDSAPSSEPAPAVPAPEPEPEPERQREPAPEPEPPPAERTQVAEAPAERGARQDGGGWVVQLGSFGNRDNAERLAEELRDKRYQSFVTRVDSGDTTLHRVRVGPAGSRSEAEATARRLAAEGYTPQPVPE